MKHQAISDNNKKVSDKITFEMLKRFKTKPVSGSINDGSGSSADKTIVIFSLDALN